jgi:O-acetyl-ADP-ribose deacetylase (regulator of RNase III)
MEIIYRSGDMFSHVFQEHQPKIFVHGCNAQGVMGSGVAYQIKRRFPFAYRLYTETHELNGLQVGSIVVANNNDLNCIVINAITQKYYGRDSNRVYVDYYAVEKCMKSINLLFEGWNTPEVVMPKIGCGLANGDWKIISNIIEKHSTNYLPIVYEI